MRVGDMVTHRWLSPAPVMRVLEIFDQSHPTKVEVDWFDKNYVYHTHTFLRSDLVKVG